MILQHTILQHMEITHLDIITLETQISCHCDQIIMPNTSIHKQTLDKFKWLIIDNYGNNLGMGISNQWDYGRKNGQ